MGAVGIAISEVSPEAAAVIRDRAARAGTVLVVGKWAYSPAIAAKLAMVEAGNAAGIVLVELRDFVEPDGLPALLDLLVVAPSPAVGPVDHAIDHLRRLVNATRGTIVFMSFDNPDVRGAVMLAQKCRKISGVIRLSRDVAIASRGCGCGG